MLEQLGIERRDANERGETGGRGASDERAELSRPADTAHGGPTTRSDAAGDARPLVESLPFRIGRAVFGGVLAFMAIDNLRNLDGRVQYAESKGAPMPDLAVPGVSASLLAGSLGVALWRLPSLATAAVSAFFVSVTPVMHDFWNAEDDESRQQQVTHFMKNAALLGAALALLGVGRRRN